MIIDPLLSFFQGIPWRDIGENSSDFLGHMVAWIVIGIGVIGTFMPLLPGPTIILLGALIHRIWLGAAESMTWISIGILILLVVLAYIVEYAASAMGAKWFGASKWGMWGALLGGIVGIFFGIPGLFIGPLAGAFAFELVFAQQKFGIATKSTWGTLLGTALGIFIKGGISLAMLAAIVIDLFMV